MLPVDIEKLFRGSPLQRRRTRLDALDRSVSAPTNRHLDRLSLESFADYVSALMLQESSGAYDPIQREIALRTAKEKVVRELGRRI